MLGYMGKSDRKAAPVFGGAVRGILAAVALTVPAGCASDPAAKPDKTGSGGNATASSGNMTAGGGNATAPAAAEERQAVPPTVPDGASQGSPMGMPTSWRTSMPAKAGP